MRWRTGSKAVTSASRRPGWSTVLPSGCRSKTMVRGSRPTAKTALVSPTSERDCAPCTADPRCSTSRRWRRVHASALRSRIMRVLIVDDEGAARQRLARLLADLDVEVAGEAADGLVALELAERDRPDVILLDIEMPEVSGLDVARRLS